MLKNFVHDRLSLYSLMPVVVVVVAVLVTCKSTVYIQKNVIRQREGFVDFIGENNNNTFSKVNKNQESRTKLESRN